MIPLLFLLLLCQSSFTHGVLMFLCPPYLGTPCYSCITTACFSYYLYVIIPPYYSVLLLLLLLLTFIGVILELRRVLFLNCIDTCSDCVFLTTTMYRIYLQYVITQLRQHVCYLFCLSFYLSSLRHTSY